MISKKLQDKVADLMDTSKTWAQLNKQDLAESVMEHVHECIIPFAEHIPDMKNIIISKPAVELAANGDDTLWVAINEGIKPDVVFYESNWHRIVSGAKSGPAELRKISLADAVSKYEVSLKKQLEDNISNFLEKAQEILKRKIAERPTDEQIRQKINKRNTKLHTLHLTLAEMYRKASTDNTE